MSLANSDALPGAAPASAGDADTDVVVLASRLLGALPVRRADLVATPAGLYGFEQCRTWALVAAGRDGTWWLQSAERPELAFLLADPFQFVSGYDVDVAPAELAALDATEETALVALVIVTLPARGGDPPTANLRAPVLVDPARRLARQIVLPDETLPLAAPIAL
jgi:flagellar assembly factor FliW